MRYTFIHFIVAGRRCDEITHVTQEDNLPCVSLWHKMVIDLNCELSDIPGMLRLAHSVWFSPGPDDCNGEIGNCPPKYGYGIAVYLNTPTVNYKDA